MVDDFAISCQNINDVEVRERRKPAC